MGGCHLHQQTTKTYHLPDNPWRQLHGHQVPSPSRLRQDRHNDQGQEPRRDQEDLERGGKRGGEEGRLNRSVAFCRSFRRWPDFSIVLNVVLVWDIGYPRLPTFWRRTVVRLVEPADSTPTTFPDPLDHNPQRTLLQPTE